MRILVTGATGAQGGAVAAALTASGHQVRGFSRDLGDAGQVKAAFAGITHASVQLPMVYEPAVVDLYVRNLIDAARAAGVRRLVFNTANRIPDAVTDVAAFETRRAAVDALRDSGLPLVVLRPPIYLDNLRSPWALTGGALHYPLPPDLPVAWLSHADLGNAVAAAMTVPDLEGETFDLGVLHTATEVAAALGVRYERQDVAAFEAGLGALAGPGLAADVGATYRWIAEHPLFTADPEVAAGRLGVRFTPVGEWAAAGEVVRHHRAISDFDVFAGAHEPEFTLVTPEGEVLSLDRVLDGVRAARGTEIEIRGIRVVADAGPYVVVTYQEWQRGQGRVSTAVLRRRGDGFGWVHLQETLTSG